MNIAKPCKLRILLAGYFSAYRMKAPESAPLIAGLTPKHQFTAADFEHYVLTSAIYSSNIEGNSLDVDTFLKNKKFQIKSKPKETAEINDLIGAYNFAASNALTKKNFLKAHRLLGRTILSVAQQRGRLRNQPVGIFSGGAIEYMAVEPEFVQQEFDKLFDDIECLLATGFQTPTPQGCTEMLYFASMIHLTFEKIHPFMDGNGRAGRLLEKWFLASFIGEPAWGIRSEEHYAKNRMAYYQNIHIGLNYYVLKWDLCLPFLLMLPHAIQLSVKT